jgi:hypothetical protein
MEVMREPKMRKDLNVKTLSVEDAAYIAGFVDGEGHVGINITHSVSSRRKVGHSIRLKITNTFPGVLDWIVERIGYGRVYTRKPFKGGVQPFYDFGLSGTRAVALLKQLYPYLKVKRLQAEVAFRYAETVGEGSHKITDNVFEIRNQCIRDIRSLNNGSGKKIVHVV